MEEGGFGQFLTSRWQWEEIQCHWPRPPPTTSQVTTSPKEQEEQFCHLSSQKASQEELQIQQLQYLLWLLQGCSWDTEQMTTKTGSKPHKMPFVTFFPSHPETLPLPQRRAAAAPAPCRCPFSKTFRHPKV